MWYSFSTVGAHHNDVGSPFFSGFDDSLVRNTFLHKTGDGKFFKYLFNHIKLTLVLKNTKYLGLFSQGILLTVVFIVLSLMALAHLG